MTEHSARRPRVSVITIFLNAERYLAEAIESVLAQDASDLELILVDDGSAEPCSALARGYTARDPRVTYLEHPGHRNRGMSASRNLGIFEARGEFIAFIDADDVWAPGKLREQVAIMDANPGLGMVCGTVRYWYSWNGPEDVLIPTGHVQNRVVRPPEASLALYPLGAAAAPCPSDLLLRREVVVALGGFEEHFTGPRQLYEDQGFLAKLYLAAPVFFSDRIWLSYRQHAESCVAEVTRNGRYDEVRLYFLNWLERYLAGLPNVDPRVRTALRRAFWRYRHPVIHKVAQRSHELLKRGRRIARRFKRTAASFAR
ncbi:MAG TPA: glycosyltransferase family 2 protein [Dongiaceae bacterium]|jgi:glycosyltransferase involved in cell wall biosynthesis